MSKPEPEGPAEVGVESFAAVYVESPTRCPPGKQLFKDHRGYYYRLDLQSLDTTDAATVVEKARQSFPVELVRQIREAGRLTKERRYVSDIDEVPDGYIPERGPQGGIYYETNPTNDPTDGPTAVTDPTEEVGYSGQPVLAVHFEDVDEDDRVAFENPETGERDIGRVDAVDPDEQLVHVESGHGKEWVRPEAFEITKSDGDGGGDATMTSDTQGAHNAVYSGEEAEMPEECRSCGDRDRLEGRMVCGPCDERLYKDCDGHHVGPYMEYPSVRLEEGEMWCEEEGESFGFDEKMDRCPSCGENIDPVELMVEHDDYADDPEWVESEGLKAYNAHLGKAAAEEPSDGSAEEQVEEVWVYYVGPKGGEGWQNMVTGEVRYQKKRPGPGPKEGDGYDDWMGDGWGAPPEDLTELVDGQPIEVLTDGVYKELEFHADEVSEDGTEYYPEADIEITAAAEYDRHDPYFDDDDYDADHYWDQFESEVPADAPDELQGIEVGETYAIDLPNDEGSIEVPIHGYLPEGDDIGLGGPAAAIHYDDLEAAVGEEKMQERWGAPGESSPTVTIPASLAPDVMDLDGEEEVAGPPDEYAEVDSDMAGMLDEGDPIAFKPAHDDEWRETTVAMVDESGDILTEHDEYAFPGEGGHDVYAPSEALMGSEEDTAAEAEALADEMEEAEGSADEEELALDWVEADAESFNSSVEAFIDDNPGMGAYLTEHPPEELADHDLYLTDDGGAGAAVSPEGDIQNVFNHTGPSGAGEAALNKAIEEGGRTLDCYDGFLPGLYKDNGFVETARQDFVADYAPEALDYDESDPPDVVFMHYEPEGDTSETSEYIDDWDQAKQASRDRAVEPGGGDTGGSGGGEGRGVGGEESGAHPESGPADGQTVTEGAVGETVDREPRGLYADAGLGELSPDDIATTHGMDKVNATTGNTIQSKQVVDFADGTEAVYTNTDHSMGDPDLGMRAVVGSQFARELFDDYADHGVPEIDGEPYDGYFFSAACPGEDVVKAPPEYKQQVDPDDFYRQAALQVMLGNNDAHVNNVKVDENGRLHWFDMDHAGGSIHNPSALNKSFEYDDSWDRMFGELARTGTGLDLGDETAVRKGIFEAAQELAADIDDSALSEARDHADEYSSEFAGNIVANIRDIASGDYPYKPY